MPAKKKSLKKKTPSEKVSLKNEKQKVYGYCLTCRAKNTLMKDVSLKLTKNGAVQVSGFCTKCNTKMNIFQKKDLFKVSK